MPRMSQPRRLLMFLLVLPMAWASASPFQPVGGEGEASLDPALRMPACGKPLQARQSTAATVEVSCPDGWRLYVPVRQRRSQQVVVLARGVAAGETLTADALATAQRDASRL